MDKKKFLMLSIVLVSAFVFCGCATQSFKNIGDLPGFFKGLFHGFTILFSFIAGFFTDYEIYAFPNSGAWYDFGYLIGVMSFFGGSGASVKCRS